MKRLLCLCIALTPLFGTNAFASAASDQFSDVKSGTYEEEVINYLVGRGIVNGFSDGTFRPDIEVTRGQFALLVSRALELPSSESSFPDVPKTAKTYDGVSKVFKAGIVKGYPDGSFKPDEPIKRSDIAIMLDRALQLEGNYDKKVTLSYTDKGEIGESSLEAIQRLTYYGILTGNNGNAFEPDVKGTRISTAISIYKLLEVLESKNSTEKDSQKMTLAQLREVYGEHVLVSRSNVSKEIVELDLVKWYYEYYQDFVKIEKFLDNYVNGAISQYEMFYPDFEVIAYNDKSYKNSTLYTEDLLFIDDEVLPQNPKSQGEFLLDLHTNSTDFAIYYKDKVDVVKMGNTPYLKNNVYFVEGEGVFKNFVDIVVSSDSLLLKGKHTVRVTVGSDIAVVNGVNKILPSAVEKKNGQIMVPVRMIAEYLGLYTRSYQDINTPNKTTEIQRIDIANFKLPNDYGL